MNSPRTSKAGALTATASDNAPFVAAWRTIILVRIANFAVLRRQIGKERAARLSGEVSAMIERLLGAPRVVALGQALVEIELVSHPTPNAAEAVEQITAAFGKPIDIDGEPIRFELTVGAAVGPLGINDVRFAEEAELALAQVEAEPGRRWMIRDVTVAPTGVQPGLTAGELALAIERDELFVQYQPKMHVRQQRVASAEALVRWQHPERGLIPPSDFIQLAEDAHLIGPLTRWTLRRVIADQRILREGGHDLLIFINISGQLVSERGFIDAACALIADNGARIGFEITETSMIHDAASAVDHLNVAAAAGIPIAIDDYGAGLSSLAYLKRLPATELKIDKMFVMELTSSHRDPLIVRSTIDLAHAMDMEVTAEGVETPAALALLSVMGCDQVQGFLLSRPLSLPAFRHFLNSDLGKITKASSFSLLRPGAFWNAA